MYLSALTTEGMMRQSTAGWGLFSLRDFGDQPRWRNNRFISGVVEPDAMRLKHHYGVVEDSANSRVRFDRGFGSKLSQDPGNVGDGD